MIRTLALIASVLAPALFQVGCSATDAPGAQKGSGGATGAGSPNGGGILDGGGAPGTPTGCSADLLRIVDSEGRTVEVCGAGQGCFETQCVDACTAAEKTQGTIGCDFLAFESPFFKSEETDAPQHGPCFAALVANASNRPAKLTVSYKGEALDVSAFARIVSGIGDSTGYASLPAAGIAPGEVAVVFLSHRPGASNGNVSLECPVPPAIAEDASIHGTGSGNAFRITSDTPVTAYDMLPYGGASTALPSASVLLPTTAWGVSYIGSSPGATGDGQLWGAVVATEASTTVTIGMGDSVPPTEVTLDAGEAYQLYDTDIGTRPITADQPIAVFSGMTAFYLTSVTSPAGGGMDAAHQQLLPVRALGSEYVAASIPSRLASGALESVVYRFFGVVNDTVLTFDPGVPPGAPSTLSRGVVAQFESDFPFVVSSQDKDHPFIVTQLMPGAPSPSATGCSPSFTQLDCRLGDEDWIQLQPAAQYLDRYVFLTDPTYGTTNVVVVRKQRDSQFKDVALDCMGALTGFQPVGFNSGYEFLHLDLVRGGAPVTGCGTAVSHQASSDAPFGIVAWGTDHFSSYGFFAGGNIATINEVVIDVPK